EHRYELANPFYQKVINRTEQQLLGRTIREVFPEMSGQGIYEVFDGVSETGKPFVANEFPATFDRSGLGRPEQGYFNFVAQPIKDDKGNVERILIHAIEVKEQVLARQRVKESEEHFKTFANNIQNLAWMAESDGGIYWYNQQWYDYTGSNFEEMQGWGWDKVHHPEHIDRVIQFIKKAWKLGETWELTFPLRGADGQYRWFLTRAYAVKDESGKVVRWIGTNTNIDEQMKAEAALKEMNATLEQRVNGRTEELVAANKELSRSNIELQDFAYVASHDLQEPLRKIISFAGLLESDYKKELPDEAQVYVTGLQKSSIRMRTLINDLLNYSRVTTKAQPFSRVDLNFTIKEVIDDLQSRIDETSATIKIGKLCSIEADPLQIRLLLQNLVSNALKYKKADVAPIIKITSKITSGNCIISIEDNGIGFDEQYTDRIFTIFQRLHGRTTYEGTGIGLAICKKIVDRHDGTITAKSKEGEGSTFIVTLPKHQKK
ncbi:MAG TPA: ATP-binding protein, partial [Candidatus Saccharimonadales bacterium]|nr:ATP-binding protein [Candidatus Saccharimonadales bacterium]